MVVPFACRVRTVNQGHTFRIIIDFEVGIIILNPVGDSEFKTDIADFEKSLATFEIHQVRHIRLVSLGVRPRREKTQHIEFVAHNLLKEIFLRQNRHGDSTRVIVDVFASGKKQKTRYCNKKMFHTAREKYSYKHRLKQQAFRADAIIILQR